MSGVQQTLTAGTGCRHQHRGPARFAGYRQDQERPGRRAQAQGRPDQGGDRVHQPVREHPRQLRQREWAHDLREDHQGPGRRHRGQDPRGSSQPDFRLAGSFVVQVLQNDVTAEIGGTAVLKSKGGISHQAVITDKVQTAAEATISHPKNQNSTVRGRGGGGRRHLWEPRPCLVDGMGPARRGAGHHGQLRRGIPVHLPVPRSHRPEHRELLPQQPRRQPRLGPRRQARHPELPHQLVGPLRGQVAVPGSPAPR